MSYAFIQQAEVSTNGQTTPQTAPSITTTTGNALIIAILGTSSITTATITDGAIGNTYTKAGSVTQVGGGTLQLQLYYASNINGGATAIKVATSPGSLNGIYVAEYSGLATSGMLINFAGQNQSGATQGANTVSSTSVTNSVSAMLFGFGCVLNTGVTAVLSAGTSPTAFTGRTGVWASFNGNATTCGLPEDALISGSAAATFGNQAGALQFDNTNTVAAAFALFAAPPPPSVPSRGPMPKQIYIMP